MKNSFHILVLIFLILMGSNIIDAQTLNTNDFLNGLPVCYIPVVGYVHHINPSELIFLWNSAGKGYFWDVSIENFVEYSDEEEQNQNIVGFRPILGYSNSIPGFETIFLWDKDGNAKVFDSIRGKFRDYTEKEDQGLADFVPVAGYSHTLTGEEIVVLWDKDGNGKVWDSSLGKFRDYTEKNDQGLTGFKPVLGYSLKLSEETIFLWDKDGNAKVWDSSLGKFRGVSDSEKTENGIPLDLKPTEGYYSEFYNKVFLWDARGNFFVWNPELGTFGQFEKSNLWPECKLNIAPSCGDLLEEQCTIDSDGDGIGDFWDEELLEAIERFNEDFASMNGLDLDFCTNPDSLPEGKTVNCGCEWTLEDNRCIEKVEIVESNEVCYITSIILNNADCEDSNVDFYNLEWTSSYGDPISGTQQNGCVDGSKTLRCPAKTDLPFFTLTNLLISLTFIFFIYFFIKVQKKT